MKIESRWDTKGHSEGCLMNLKNADINNDLIDYQIFGTIMYSDQWSKHLIMFTKLITIHSYLYTVYTLKNA